jgi:MFS family permease
LALSILLVQARGLTLTQIGLVMGVYSILIVLLELPTGGLADAVGRKRVALLAYALAALSSLALLFAFSFPAYLGAMALYAVSRALSSGALDAWFVDMLQATDPQVDLQPALAQIETVTLAGLGMGTLIGGALPRFFASLPPDGAAILTPLAVPIMATLVVRLALLPVVLLLIHEPRPDPGRGGWWAGVRAVPANVRDAARLSRDNTRLVLLMVISFVGGFAVLGLESFWQPFFAALPGATGANGAVNTFLFGVIMAGNFAMGMFGNLLATPLSRLLGGRLALVGAIARLLQGGWLLALAASAILVPATAFFWLVYLMAGVGVSPHATLVNEELPPERRSAMLSVQSLAFFAGCVLGSAALGRMADLWSIGAAWTVAGVLVIASCIPYVLLERGGISSRDRALSSDGVRGSGG